ncbi:ATP-grasp domain-containing protein [Dichotomicrobium thermohalophilum]|uniref:Carbamoyl-phosphate synthase L subunit-like protein n=1 Tax=Dichotomicrobium thermohalophilum TaxID=933063 RepID=A0A397QA17_9HYPH|nr:ATP-grasp domain-containing protein [Dichotomicrobium thermohalophilum]RIA55091.1 carbamoyl-phosphate synthase L subunit-like protein [Dichotomicrobium thermohalophilum]
MKNIFVIGLEPFNLALLEQMEGAKDYAFHTLLTYEEAVRPASSHIEFDELLRTAETCLYNFDGSVDAIIGYWDFPSSALAPMLQKEFGLSGPSLEAVAKCEHKYWSRCVQKEVLPDLLPRFFAVDPFLDDPLGHLNLSYPFWIKPIKAHSSYLGFEIADEADFRAALPIIRDNIADFADAFNEFLQRVNTPPEIAPIGGYYCIAEEIISAGHQCTLEGYAYEDEVEVYGIIDSVREGERQSSFARYQYPSRLPGQAQMRMKEAACQLVKHIGYRNAPFNIEFYWDSGTDCIWLLEINARISKSHSPLFMLVDGETHQKVAIDLAMGRRPSMPHRQGHHRLAGKFMMRVFDDCVVTRVPGPQDIARVIAEFPEGMVRLMVEEGQRLSHLLYQDSYSFEIAEIFLGAGSEDELMHKYDKVCSLLPFAFSSIEEANT